ncbi:signal peptidase II [Acetonema longum]|uniref:Lipoprotein signal peptidase n=1 Tax=Acetonema longum DSM 6540 TaxID=1009370 RepID=F7NLC8_9FIRM|nr:signal peptidase II [Acetonema longum]EGO63233.1 lipoprotein signal peptidase [Acetonema longum DSM 6540]
MPILLLAVTIILLDQWVKYYVQTHMTLGMSIPVVPDIFHITYILNPGAAFGILEHQTTIFIAVAILLVVAVVYFYPRIPKGCRLLRLGIGLQVGGAVGNVIDRIRTGYVVDFLDFRIWPVFNIADMAIVIGVGCIVISMFYFMPSETGKENGDSRS